MRTRKRRNSFNVLFTVALAVALLIGMTVVSNADEPAVRDVADWDGLKEALGAGGTVQLTQDIAAEAGSPALTVPAGVTTTLDLCGHTIDRSDPNDTEETQAKTTPAITVSGGDLTLTDSGTNGKITGANTGESLGTSTTFGGGVVLESGSFTMKGGEISGNRSAETGGGGVLVKDGTFTMEDGKILNNIGGTSSGGGGVLVEGGSFTMKGGEISGNNAISGGGVSIRNDGKFFMEDGEIADHILGSSSDGGGVYLTDSAVFIMSGGKITGNKATNGGGVCVQSTGCSVTMADGEISGNEAANGGGVYVCYNLDTQSSGAVFNMLGGTISSNHANIGGGVCCPLNSKIAVFNDGNHTACINGNTADSSGGGVALTGYASQSSGSTLSVVGAVDITGNKKGTGDNAVASNVHLDTEFDKIILSGAITNSTIGVTMKTPGVFTSSNETYASDYAGCFFSDNGELAVQAEENELKLAAAESYPVWVGATQVTKTNKDDVLGDGGKVKYDPTAKTLTLNDPTIPDVYSHHGSFDACIYSESDTLVIKGRATLTNPGATSISNGIYVNDCNLELDGNFIIKATYYGIGANRSDVTVSGGNVNVTSDAGINGRNVEIKGGTVISASKGSSIYAKNIIIGEGLSIVKPEGGKTTNDDYSQWIMDADGNRAHIVVISSESDLALVTFVDGQGKTLKADAVKPGQAATAPADPTREGYTFDGWDADFSNVTADLTVTAKWKEASDPASDPSQTDSGKTKPGQTKPGQSKSKPVSISNAKVVISAAAFTYNGKVRKPVIRTIGGKALKAGTDYTAKWSNAASKNVGSYTVTITGKGKYTGVTKAKYRIDPKGTKLKKPKKAKKAITVKWKKQSAKMSKSRITGYQIQIATNKTFTKNRKTVNVKGYKKTSKKIKKLKGGKKYYVKIRTYKTVNGTKFYSKWSKVRKVKTKK